MIRFDKLLADGIVTEKQLLSDLELAIRESDVDGEIRSPQGLISWYEKSFPYGTMRVEAEYVPDDGKFNVIDAYLIDEPSNESGNS